jgi:signal transduction histidine kinase
MRFEHGQQPMRLRLQSATAELKIPLFVAIAYYLGAEAAFLIGTLSDKIFAPFWPPNVVLFCALLLAAQRRWWIYIAAVFPAHVIAELGVGMPVPQLVVAFVTNCMVALISAIAVRRLLVGPPWLGDLRKASLYILITAVASPAVSALGGAVVPILGGGPIENYWIFWGHWYVANALANLTLGPIFLSWFGEGASWPITLSHRRQLEAGIVAIALVVISLFAFEFSPKALTSGFLPALLYSPLPIVLWAALRFGAKGASAAILIVTVVLVSHSVRGPSMFAGSDPESNVLALQLFLTGLAVPVLLLGALVDELRRAEWTMRELAGSVLRAQDDERRRIARELHDSISQNLASASLTAERIRGTSPDKTKSLLGQLDDGLQQSIHELRSLSYVLHPPHLDEAGLELALRAYLGGYSERSGQGVDLDIAPNVDCLPAEAELILFRLVQETLADCGPQQGGGNVRIRMYREPAPQGPNVVLTIETAEAGVPAEVSVMTPRNTHVRGGMAGLRERLRQIGGRLDIRPAAGRTIVAASVPV